MNERVRKPRRWPWILACVVLFFLGLVGGVGISGAVVTHNFNVACPPLFRPTQAEMDAVRGPGTLVARPLSRPTEMPRAGAMARVRGSVLVLARVETDGTVSRSELVGSSGFCPYDLQALKDVRRWKFTPATRLGKPFPSWVPLTLVYSLNPAPARRTSPRGGTDI